MHELSLKYVKNEGKFYLLKVCRRSWNEMNNIVLQEVSIFYALILPFGLLILMRARCDVSHLLGIE